PNFLPAQAPSGAEWNDTQALLILRAGNILLGPRDSPRNRGPGKGEYERVSAHPEPSPVAFCLLCRHGQSRSPPAGGEIPPARNETALSSPPHPSRLRRATFPPRGRLFGEYPLIRRLRGHPP